MEHIRASGGQRRIRLRREQADAVQTMVDQVLADWGRIDVLVSNSRVQPHAALLEMDEWDWKRTLEVNLSGSFLVLQQAAWPCAGKAAGRL